MQLPTSPDTALDALEVSERAFNECKSFNGKPQKKQKLIKDFFHMFALSPRKLKLNELLRKFFLSLLASPLGGAKSFPPPKEIRIGSESRQN